MRSVSSRVQVSHLRAAGLRDSKASSPPGDEGAVQVPQGGQPGVVSGEDLCHVPGHHREFRRSGLDGAAVAESPVNAAVRVLGAGDPEHAGVGIDAGHGGAAGGEHPGQGTRAAAEVNGAGHPGGGRERGVEAVVVVGGVQLVVCRLEVRFPAILARCLCLSQPPPPAPR